MALIAAYREKKPSYGCIVCVCCGVCGREDHGIFDVNNMKYFPALLLAGPDFLRYKKLLRNVYVRKMYSFFENS